MAIDKEEFGEKINKNFPIINSVLPNLPLKPVPIYSLGLDIEELKKLYSAFGCPQRNLRMVFNGYDRLFLVLSTESRTIGLLFPFLGTDDLSVLSNEYVVYQKPEEQAEVEPDYSDLL